MSERTYKQAFVMSAVICFVLAGTLAYVIWGRGTLCACNRRCEPCDGQRPRRSGATAG